jgi:3',5'-cyclic AMP phosphodiesterase CpdA
MSGSSRFPMLNTVSEPANKQKQSARGMSSSGSSKYHGTDDATEPFFPDADDPGGAGTGGYGGGMSGSSRSRSFAGSSSDNGGASQVSLHWKTARSSAFELHETFGPDNQMQ